MLYCEKRLLSRSAVDRFLAIKMQRAPHGLVADRVEDGVLAACVLMMVQRPWRNDEDVPLAPFQPLSIDHRGARAPKRLIEHGRVVAVRPGDLVGSKKLNGARHGREGWPAIDGILEIDPDSIVGVRFFAGFQRNERGVRVGPSVAVRGWNELLVHSGRPRGARREGRPPLRLFDWLLRRGVIVAKGVRQLRELIVER